MFTGEIQQIPPMYSAIRHNGKRLYELARQGIDIDRPARVVKVLRNELVHYEPPSLVLNVECSHGFYARTLAHDLGKYLGTYAHMQGLLRTKAGVFSIENSVTIDQLSDVALNTLNNLYDEVR